MTDRHAIPGLRLLVMAAAALALLAAAGAFLLVTSPAAAGPPIDDLNLPIELEETRDVPKRVVRGVQGQGASITAQTSGTLVSNMNVTGGTTVTISGPSKRAQSFATGSNSGGYTLTSVEMLLRGSSQSSHSVSIHASSRSGKPGITVATLTKSVSLTMTPAVVSFPAPSDGIDLVANTTYWLVVTPSSAFSIDGTFATGEDPGGADGWSIGNDKPLEFQNSNWVTGSTFGIFRLDVKGYAIDRLSEKPRAPITVTYTNADGEDETVEVTASSANRDTLWDYFEAECTRTGQWERFVNDMRVAVRYCASHKLYVRQQNCASADWLARNPHLHESLCPTYRTW